MEGRGHCFSSRAPVFRVLGLWPQPFLELGKPFSPSPPLSECPLLGKDFLPPQAAFVTPPSTCPSLKTSLAHSPPPTGCHAPSLPFLWEAGVPMKWGPAELPVFPAGSAGGGEGWRWRLASRRRDRGEIKGISQAQGPGGGQLACLWFAL